MAFERIVKRGNRYYRYREWRWREGGKVCSRSVCLGPADGYTSYRRMNSKVEEVITRGGLTLRGEDAQHYLAKTADDQDRIGIPAPYLRDAPKTFEQRHRDYNLTHPSPATRAKDEYLALRAQQQAQIRSYWSKVEDEQERTHKANEEWAKEHASSREPAPPSAPEPSSEKE